MNNKLEPYLHLTTALVSAVAPLLLNPIAAGLALATISVAHAVDASAEEDFDRQTP